MKNFLKFFSTNPPPPFIFFLARTLVLKKNSVLLIYIHICDSTWEKGRLVHVPTSINRKVKLKSTKAVVNL